MLSWVCGHPGILLVWKFEVEEFEVEEMLNAEG